MLTLTPTQCRELRHIVEGELSSATLTELETRPAAQSHLITGQHPGQHFLWEHAKERITLCRKWYNILYKEEA